MAQPFFLSIPGQIGHQKRPGADDAHIPFPDIKKFRQFIQAGRPEQLSEFGQPVRIRQKVSVLIPFICHGTEFAQGKYFFIPSGTFLMEKHRASQLYPHQNGNHQKYRAYCHNGDGRKKKIKQSFTKLFIKHPDLFSKELS